MVHQKSNFYWYQISDTLSVGVDVIFLKTQMSNPPEAASYRNSTKLSILLPLWAIYFYSLHYETPCTYPGFFFWLHKLCISRPYCNLIADSRVQPSLKRAKSFFSGVYKVHKMLLCIIVWECEPVSFTQAPAGKKSYSLNFPRGFLLTVTDFFFSPFY